MVTYVKRYYSVKKQERERERERERTVNTIIIMKFSDDVVVEIIEQKKEREHVHT